MTSLLWINSYLNPDYICAKCLSLVVIFIILISHHRASSKVWLQLTLLSKLKTEQTYCKNMHTNTCPMIEPQVNIKKRKGRMRWRATAHAHAHRAFPRGTVRSVSTCSHLIRGGAWQAQVSQSPGGTTEADEERKLIKAQFNVRTVGGAETTWKLLRSWKPPGSFTEPQKSSNLLNQLISSPRTYNDQRPPLFHVFSFHVGSMSSDHFHKHVHWNFAHFSVAWKVHRYELTGMNGEQQVFSRRPLVQRPIDLRAPSWRWWPLKSKLQFPLASTFVSNNKSVFRCKIKYILHLKYLLMPK